MFHFDVQNQRGKKQVLLGWRNKSSEVNFSKADYKDTIRAGINNCARLLNQEASKFPNSIVLDPEDTFTKHEDSLHSSMGIPIAHLG